MPARAATLGHDARGWAHTIHLPELSAADAVVLEHDPHGTRSAIPPGGPREFASRGQVRRASGGRRVISAVPGRVTRG